MVDVAQVRTITTLRLLDAKRRNILFQFLRDSNLADFILVGASLQEVDLSDTIRKSLRNFIIRSDFELAYDARCHQEVGHQPDSVLLEPGISEHKIRSNGATPGGCHAPQFSLYP